MRIEVNAETEKLLDEIRAANYIYGKGHTGTILFLARYYDRHGALHEVLDKRLGKLDASVEKAVRKVFRDILLNLMKPQGE